MGGGGGYLLGLAELCGATLSLWPGSRGRLRPLEVLGSMALCGAF